MTQLTVQSATIIPFSKHLRASSAGFAVAYSYQPPIGSRGVTGTLMASIEVLGTTVQAEATIDAIMQTIGDSYYDESLPEDTTPGERFSSAIAAVNEAIASQRPSGSKDWEQRINAAIGVLADNVLYVSHTGGARVYLIRGERHSTITRPLPSDADDLFTEVASGQLVAGDKLLFVSPALLHQLAEGELIEIVTDSVPTTSIRKISELLAGQTNLERVAALVATATTPELLAMQALNTDSTQIEIGKPAGFLKSKRPTGAPAVTTEASLRAKRTLERGGKAGKKLAKRQLTSLRSGGRHIAAQPRTWAIGGAVVVILAASFGFAALASSNNATLDRLATQYTAAANEYKAGTAATDDTEAEKRLDTANKALTTLEKDKDAKKLPKAIKKHPVSGAPSSVAELRKAISAESDKRSGAVRRTASKVVPAPSNQGSGPHLIAMLGRQAISMPTKGGAVSGFDLDKNQALPTAQIPGEVGTITAITAGSGGDAVYILTDAPTVWAYKPADGSFTKQELSDGEWPKGSAIASYNNSLYILASDRVTKQVPTLAGFSAPTTSLTLPEALRSATTLTIDGSIFVGGAQTGINRFLAGKLTSKLSAVPVNVSNASQLIADDDTLLSLDKTTGRIGIFEITDSAITYRRQVIIEGASQLTGLSYDLRTGGVYAVAKDGAIYKISLQ